MKYTQEQQNQILSRINAGVIGKRKQKTWDSIAIRTKWSKEKVLEYCKKYNNYSELSTGALNYALKNGFIEEAIAHMDKNIKWDFKQAKTVAKLYKTRKEFSLSKYQSAYNWAIRENKLDQICSHMPKHKFEVSKETAFQRVLGRAADAEVVRADDNEEVFLNRMKLFTDPLAEIQEFYSKKNLLEIISGESSIEEVVSQMDKFIQSRV